MESVAHRDLKNRAESYLMNKGYWICGVEVPMPLGVCDAWGMNHSSDYVKGNFDAMAIEVKVSRTDFRSRSQQYKELSSIPLGNYQYILCPAGMIQPEEMHHEWGLLWGTDNGRIINKKKAPRIEMLPEEKLRVLIRFLHNGNNQNRPRLPTQDLLPLPI